MKESKDLKIYILSISAIIIYAIIISLSNLPLAIANIDINTLNNSNKQLYMIIYQAFAIGSSILYVLNEYKKDYNEITKHAKSAILGILAITAYFFLSQIELLPLQLLDINYQTMPIYLKVIYLLCYEAIIIAIVILIHSKKLKKDIKDIKINHQTYFKECIRYWFISLFIMYFSNLIISLLNSGGLPTNEEIIRKQFEISPIYIFVSAVIFAPLLEELIFRQSFKNIFTNKWLFIIISGLVFGGMHVFTNEITSYIDVLYLIPYSVPGMAFAYMLHKTDNIFVSIGIHMLHNGIMIALQFFIIYFV